MKPIQSISIYLLVIIVSLSYSHSDTTEFEKSSPLDFYNSVSLIDGDLLDRFIIREVSESFRILPNVSISDSVDSGFLIRGINAEGNGLFAGKPLANIYVDGISQSINGARRGSLGTWDLEKISLMRGPQGTSGGRVSVAGQINLETKDPTFFEEGSLLLGLGENNLYESALMISGPINEYLAARFTAEMLNHDGEFNYPLSGGLPKLSERKDDNYYQLRTKILYQPFGKDGLTAKLTALHSYDAPQYQDVDGPSAGVQWADRIWGLQSLPAFIPALSTEVSQASLSIFNPINEHWSIESLTGVIKTYTEIPSIDLSKKGAINEKNHSRQITTHYKNGPIKSSLGIYYLDSKTNQNYDQKLPFNDFSSQSYENKEFENIAFFGEVHFQILPRWSLFGGLRYDHEKLDFNSIFREVKNNQILASKKYSNDYSDDALLPKIGINHNINEDTLITLGAQNSYRSGGLGYDYLNTKEYSYDDENVWNYEFSLSGKMPQKNINYSANIFYMDWKDQQLSIPQIPGDTMSSLVMNAKDSHVYGGEFEIQAKPSNSLLLYASIGTAITEFKDFEFSQLQTQTNLSGQKFPRTPNYSASAGLEYQFEGGYFIGGDINYNSSRISRSIFEGLERDDLASYTTLNFRIGYKTDEWTITAFANNLTDEEYFLYRYDTPKLQVGTLGLGRFFGLRASYNF